MMLALTALSSTAIANSPTCAEALAAIVAFAPRALKAQGAPLSLMQLFDAEMLDFGAPVTRYLPEFRIASGGKPILMHQLLSHCGGVPDAYSASARNACGSTTST